LNRLRHWLRGSSGEGGFSLAEILVALSVMSVGLLGVAVAFGFGVDGVEAGRQQSTAVFLAEQRLEQAKELAARAPNLQDLVSANLANAEAYGTIAGAPPRYRRTTTITSWDSTSWGALSAGTTGKKVDVVVLYQPVTGRGVLTTERSVTLSGFFATR
jgi:prepilin-type N-terminal cleavage/methylation domain-containing protein